MCIASFYQCPKTKGEKKQTSAKGYSREKEGSASYSFQAYNCGSVEGVTDGRTLGAVSVQTCLRLASEEIRGAGDWGNDFFQKVRTQSSCPGLCIGERSTASFCPQHRLSLPVLVTHQNANGSAAQKARRAPKPLAGGGHTAASLFSVRRQQEGRKWEGPAGSTRTPSGVLIWTAAASGCAVEIDAHTRRAGSAALAAAERGRAGERPRRREAAACRAGTSRADGLEGPDLLPPGSVRPISGRSEWNSHRTTSPLPAALPYAGRGGLGGHRTPPPRPDTSGFSALWPLPSSPRVRPLHRGTRTKLPQAGGGS